MPYIFIYIFVIFRIINRVNDKGDIDDYYLSMTIISYDILRNNQNIVICGEFLDQFVDQIRNRNFINLSNIDVFNI